MPPRIPLNAQQWRSEPYVCRKCLLQATSRPTATQAPRMNIRLRPKSTTSQLSPRRPRLHDNSQQRASFGHKYRRQVSNGALASSTAINAPSAVPQRYRGLHQSLLELQEVASSYVDRSRLQLAIRSLESEQPATRVAFLGLGEDGLAAARKLARILLGDALSEEEEWEKELVIGIKDGRSLLLRHGDVNAPVQSSPQLKTMNLPSRYLERNRLEILITPLNANRMSPSWDFTALEDAIVVPSLTLPNSNDGRVGFVRYPVHKSVVVADGVAGAIDYGQFAPWLKDSMLIKACINTPLLDSSSAGTRGSDSSSVAVDVDLATHALALFRTSKANGAQFSDEWQRSRLPVLSEWIGNAPAPTDSKTNGTIEALISSVIRNVSTAISRADEEATAAAIAATVPEAKRLKLQSAIAEWSADAHRDLQQNLDTALNSSPSWQRTVWWRLFWRIDDVSISASDVLRQSWLKQAEQRLAFLSGRIAETGLASDSELSSTSTTGSIDRPLHQATDVAPEQPLPPSVAELAQIPSIISRMQRHDGNDALSTPWPRTIALSRLHKLDTLVPELHRKAQSLLLSTISTIGGSAALAVWFYVATAGLALYESGAILSLGLVWSLRRLQKKWGKERDGFADTVREDARRVLGEVEGHLRKLVQLGGRVTVNAEDARAVKEAEEAVERCREVLRGITSR